MKGASRSGSSAITSTSCAMAVHYSIRPISNYSADLVTPPSQMLNVRRELPRDLIDEAGGWSVSAAGMRGETTKVRIRKIKMLYDCRELGKGNSMSRGGYRPGAGRPEGSKTKVRRKVAAPRRPEVEVTPLEYMLSVMSDPNTDPLRRDKMAIAAAPFMHPRVADARYGKKDAERDRAEEMGKKDKYATPPIPPRLVVGN
jgi:hypothetical protein